MQRCCQCENERGESDANTRTHVSPRETQGPSDVDTSLLELFKDQSTEKRHVWSMLDGDRTPLQCRVNQPKLAQRRESI
jgi:hypothetical protein